MNDPRDNGFSGPGSAAGQSGPPGVGQPRKPRIEVLQRSPAAAPGDGPGQDPTSGFGAAGAAAPGGSPAQSSWVAPNPPQHAEAPPERRRGGLSRTSLLMLLAGIVIAGFLLYTYLSSERDAEYPDKATELSPADADLLGNPEADSDRATAEEPGEPPAPASVDDQVAADPEPDDSTAAEPPAPRAAARDAQPVAVADRAEESPAPRPADGAGASDTVRAFYAALSAGDGTSAARLVIPAKRQSGPLSAGALSRYYSSFRRPLRLRSVAPVDANTVRVAYDYVLADGRVCNGQAAVDVVQRDGRNLVSSIRTRGPC